ncbi:PREDICTED: collagen alpha-6(VI) chain [Nanorana parkeri]|uniref:collagen alpha-6(VI) chain n=1 Tax=Nanorana parkeri TaxID=125878 RepID=UPI00085439B4|nr:PREDICTED: collagen alpha-6(VI) chain [Nanorana parkeri]
MVDISQHSQSESINLNKFLNEVISGLEISENCVHVGITVFDSSARVIATLDTGDDKTIVEQLLGKIKPSKEKISNIGGAINFTRTDVFGGKLSSRKSQGTPKIAILVTHRSSADNISEAAKLLHRENVNIFTVGIAQANETQMYQAASYPIDRYYIKVKTFADLSSQADILVKKILNQYYHLFVVHNFNSNIDVSAGCLNTDLADIYLLIDGSGSIQRKDFIDIKTFLEKLVDMFDIGPEKVRVAAVQYSQAQQVEIEFGQKYDKDSLKQALQNIRQLGGGTDTGAALNFTRQIIVDPKNVRTKGVPIHLIVLTDGASQDSVKEAAEIIRGDKVNVYAIGVKEANKTQLEEIAGDSKRVHYVQNFDFLKDLKNELAQQICSAEVCHNVAADVMFLVDSSGSIGKEDFNKMKTFMKTLVNRTDVGADKVQFGIVQFSDTTMEVLQLNKNGTKDSIWSAIDNMIYMAKTTYTGKALKFVAEYFKEDKGARPRVKKILILITDGQADDGVKTPAESLRNSSVVIFSVGVFNAVKSQLIEISGTEKFVRYLESFDTLQTVEEDLVFGICTSVEDCDRVQLADIVFVMDSSGSISDDQFKTMKNFIIAIINKSEVGPNNVQFGALKYSDDSHTIFYLNEHSSKQKILKAIEDTPRVGLDTYTAEALGYAKSFFTEKHGSRKHLGVDQILIIITDGESHDRTELNKTSKALQDAGIIIYAIGVDKAKTDELVTMAGTNGKWFFVENFDGLNHLLTNISGDVCNKTGWLCLVGEADLTFLIDGSSSISTTDFNEIKKFMISIVDDFDVGPNKVHVGVAQYSHLFKVEFNLATHRDKRALKDDIEKISKLEGNTYMGNALTQTDSTLLSLSGKSRMNAGIRQVLLVITDGVSHDKVAIPAQTLRGKGVDIYAIGIGSVDDTQLVQIAGSREKRFLVSNFNGLKDVKKRIVRDACTQPAANNCSVDVVVAFDISVYPNGAKLFHGQSHLEAQLDKILHSMMDMKAVTCTRGLKPQISVAFHVPNAETPVSPLFQIYSQNIAQNLRKTNVTGPSYLKSPLINSMWKMFQNKDTGKAKMLLVFTDGLDDNVEDLEETVEDLRKKGLSGLVAVALEGAKYYDDIKHIEFGRGFEYNYQMYIGMPDIGARLSKQMSHVAEKTCCCVFCKCVGERGSPGTYGSRGKPGSPGKQGVQGHSGEEGDDGERGTPGPIGEPGEKGCAGTRGLKGNRGLPGEKNEEGETGLDGIPGEQGISGRPGSKGEKGEGGEAGSPGTKGPPGHKGDQGFRGYLGEPGTPDTIPGLKGYKGDPGIEGEPGQPGIRGQPGVRGAGNLPGRRGSTGLPGVKGDPGLPGFMGDQGTKGPQAYINVVVLLVVATYQQQDPVHPPDQFHTLAESMALASSTLQNRSRRDPNHCDGSSMALQALGAAGSKGTEGEKGGQGPNGLLGAFGAKGGKGSPGNTGTTGKKGESGDPGENGTPGPRGPRGPAGEDGKPGFGKTAQKGTKGEQGFPGNSGVKGVQGDPGKAGGHGPKGAPGRTVTSAIGKPGDPGQSGPPGRRGRKGDKGHSDQSPCELIDFIRQTCPCCHEKATCPAYPTELVLALDMANGMTPEIFTRMTEMVTSLLSNIAIRGSNCPVGARVAVVSYNTHTKHLIRFSDFHNQNQLLSAVKNIPLESSGRRDIGNCMRFVGRNIFKRSVQGATVRRIAVFFSNGPSEDVVAINTAVMEYSALGIIPAVIAFSAAPAIKRAFSVDDTGTFKYIDIPLSADYKPLLQTLQTCTLCFDRCKPNPQCVNRPLLQRPSMDIAFLLDSSYNMKQDNFAAAKGLISTMVDRLDVSSSGDRVALVSNIPPNFRQNSEENPHVEFDLSTYNNNMLIKKHLLSVSHLQGPPALGYSLQWTIENIMSKVSNARKYKAIILILSGETSGWDKHALAQASLNTKCQGYPLFVLYIGKTYNDTELMDLPSIPVDHHLLHIGRIHKPEFGYALGFMHSFLNSIRRSINKYPPPELKSKCSAVGSPRGKRLSSFEDELGTELPPHASINLMAKDESADFNTMEPLLSLTVDSVSSHTEHELFNHSGKRKER